MSFTKEIFSTFLTRVGLLFLGLLSSIIIARWYGPEGKGAFALLSVLASFVVTWGILGVHSANTYFISKTPHLAPTIVANSFWFGLAGGAVSFGILLTILFTNPSLIIGALDPRLFAIGLLVILPMLWQQLFQSILIAVKQVALYNWIQLGERAIFLGGLALLAFVFGANLHALFVLVVVVAIIIALAYFISLIKSAGISFSFDPSIFKNSLVYGFRAYVASFFAFLIFRSDLYLINFFQGATATGIYSVATGLGDVLVMFPAVVALLFFPRVTREKENQVRLTIRILWVVMIVLFVLLVLSALLARFIIGTLYGQAFFGAYIPFLILLPGILAWSGTNILSQFFAGRGFPWYAVWIWLPGAALNIFLNIFLIPRYGIVAAAWTSLISYGLAFMLHVSFFKIKTRLSFVSLFPQKEDALYIVSTLKQIIQRP